MSRIQIGYIEVNYSALNTFVRTVEMDVSSTQKGLLAAARLYVSHLKERFLRFAQGGGNWRTLKPTYRRQKPRNKDLILFLNGQLFNDISVRRSRSTRMLAYNVGYVRGSRHGSFPGTIRSLANIHQNIGVTRTDGVVRRQIIVLPTTNVRRQMFKLASIGVSADVRRANRATGR